MVNKKKQRKQQQKAKQQQQQAATAETKDFDFGPAPGQGWVVEASAAHKKAKEAGTAASFLREAIARRALRQWKKCTKAAAVGLKLEETLDEDTKQRLLLLQAEAQDQIATECTSRVHQESFKQMVKKMMTHEITSTMSRAYNPTFSNLALVHYAAIMADVPLLEKAVALGAAIDASAYADPPQHTHIDNEADEALPEGTTALLLVCVTLAAAGTCRSVLAFAPYSSAAGNVKQYLDNLEECAIRLVELGADCSRKFEKPDSSGISITSHDEMLLTTGLYGKTITELAKICKRERLQEAIKKIQQDMISNVHCRCGSRLPWKQCHGWEGTGQSPHYIQKDGTGTLLFRFSPLAPCVCELGQNIYFKCCWTTTPHPTYLNDATTAKNQYCSAALFAHRIQEKRRKGVKCSSGDVRLREEHVRMLDQHFLYEKMNHPKSKMGSWDPDVYAGCYEPVDFHWTDVHWHLSESELLARVRHWNDALDEYCNDKGLVGVEREAVVKQHMANPLAPCANPTCDVFETSTKEFSKCSRCKLVAYCSRSCQNQHWKKGHKKECLCV